MKSGSGGEKYGGKGRGADLRELRPMDAVAALYSEGDREWAEAILSSLSKAVFDEPAPRPASRLQSLLSRFTHRIVKRTTTRHQTAEGETLYRNQLLERSRHPYAKSLLASSTAGTQSLVEGGDPMNGPYMMLAPEIRENATTWDKLFFNSVQGRDVQLRFVWETRATYEQAKKRLAGGRVVNLKALAGGTGLSMILAYDRLVREEQGRITCLITDRDSANTEKTGRLLGKLAAKRGWNVQKQSGISAVTEDIFAGGENATMHDVVTAVGILEYLQGFTCDTTERRHRLPEPEEAITALHLAEKLGAITNEGAAVIVNSSRPHPTTRLLELFGKQFDYRDQANVDAVMAGGGFHRAHTVGSAAIYDVIVYEKTSRR